MAERYRAPIFWVVLAALACVFLAADGPGEMAAGSRGRGLAAVQQFAHWLLVEPLGLFGAMGLVMGLGAVAAALTWPRN